MALMKCSKGKQLNYARTTVQRSHLSWIKIFSSLYIVFSLFTLVSFLCCLSFYVFLWNVWSCTNSVHWPQWMSSYIWHGNYLFFNSLFLRYAFWLPHPIEFTNKNVGFNHSRLPIRIFKHYIYNFFTCIEK